MLSYNQSCGVNYYTYTLYCLFYIISILAYKISYLSTNLRCVISLQFLQLKLAGRETCLQIRYDYIFFITDTNLLFFFNY